MSETKQGNKTDKKSKGSNKSKKTKPGILSRIIHSEQFPKAMGVCVAILTIFCFVCFVSFFWSWSEDYTKMQSLSPLKLLVGEQDIANWGVFAVLSLLTQGVIEASDFLKHLA